MTRAGSRVRKLATRQGDRRSRLVLRNSLAALVVKGLALFVSLATLPSYIAYFDDQVALGAWLTSVSVVNWLLTLDFGIGNGMRNELVAALPSRADAARNQIAGAYGASFGLGLIALTAGGPVIFLVDWPSILGVGAGPASPEDLTLLVAGLWITVITQFILRVVTFLLYALQRSAINNVLALATSVLILCYLVLAPRVLDDPGVGHLLVAYFTAVNLPLLVATLWVFRGPLRGLQPSDPRRAASEAPSAFSSGRTFFLNQVLYTAIVGTAPFIIARLSGAEDVVVYQAYYTVFYLSGMVVQIALTPFWSGVTEAFVAKEHTWIGRALNVAESFAAVTIIVQIALAIGLQEIFDVWLGPGAVIAEWQIALAFVTYGTGFAMHGVAATFASGLSLLRLQAWTYAVGLMVKAAIVVIIAKGSGEWFLIPLADGLVFWVYFGLERSRLRRWIRLQAQASTPRPASITLS